MNPQEIDKQLGGTTQLPISATVSTPSTTSPSQIDMALGGSTSLQNHIANVQTKPQESIGQKIGNFFTGNTQAFGKTAGEAFAAPRNTELYAQSVKDYTDISNNLLKTIKAKQALGQDTARLEDALHQHLQDTPKLENFVGQDTARRINETFGQNAEEIGGQALGTALEATSGGLLETGAKGLASKTLSTGQKLAQGAKIGAAYGTVGGVANAMANQEDLGGVATQGVVGGVLGAGLGVGAEVLGAGIGKVAGSINKSAWFNNLLPKTAARIEKQAGWVTKAQDNLAKEYQKALPLTPLQQSKEASLLSKRGDNVYTTLAKYNINVADPESVAHLQSLSDQFENATQHAQVNEHAYFTVDEIKARAFADINQNIPSETARATAKAKIENELDAMMSKNKGSVIDGPNGTKMINSDLVERLRRTGNSWTNFNASDPEKIGKSTGYALSNAVREQVDKQGTFPSYRYANSEWGKIIHAQEILNKIDASGKSFRTLGGLSGSIARKVLSGTLGYHAGGIGGAILSELGTEYSAKILSNPEFRTYFDRKLIEKFGSSKATPEAISKLENEIRMFLDNQSELTQIPAQSSFSGKQYVSPSGVVGNSINEVRGAESTLKQQNVDRLYGQTKSDQVNSAKSMGINTTGQNIVPNSNPMNNTNTGFISNTVQNIKDKVNSIPNKQGGFATGIGYKETGNLTTKILKDLEGKTTVSKQYILDATNRGELKQVERDLVRRILNEYDDIKQVDIKSIKPEYYLPNEETPAGNMYKVLRNEKALSEYQSVVDGYKKKIQAGEYVEPIIVSKKGVIVDGQHRYSAYKELGYKDIPIVEGNPMEVFGRVKSDTINVSDFAKKVKAELLPLKRMSIGKQAEKADMGDGVRLKYENISLPDDLRGSVKNYDENIYRSPIKTSAGRTHFSDVDTGDYFGHTRIEDMADNKTRRVIEVQSDLYQKGNLEKELGMPKTATYKGKEYTVGSSRNGLTWLNELGTQVKSSELNFNYDKSKLKEVSKLQQYNDPTAHFRMIREEIKKASQDGKTKLQFPTGETAMKIEGLGQQEGWTIKRFPKDYRAGGSFDIEKLTPEKLKVGERVWQGEQGQGRDWIITDVLGDGKFKAVPKRLYDDAFEAGGGGMDRMIDANRGQRLRDYQETFDISGKVDANNPIYKFYEKDVQKYLNKFGGKRIVDDKGVSWIEVPITKEQGKAPVEAFGKIRLGTLGTGAVVGVGVVAGAKAINKKK